MKRYDQWDQVSPVTEQEDGRFALYDEAQDEFETMAKLCATKIEQQQAEIDALVTALDMLKDKYMAVQYPMMWLHDVVKIDPEVEQADRLTNEYKHKA